MNKVYLLKDIKYKSIPIIINKETSIYFLLEKGQVVYVGQTRNSVSDRILSHSKEKDFDAFSSFAVNDKELDEIESENIIFHRPKYNQLVNSDFYRTSKNMAKCLDINIWKFRRFIKKYVINGYPLNDKVFYKNADFFHSLEGV